MMHRTLVATLAGLSLGVLTACQDDPITPAAPEVTTETTLQAEPGETVRVLVRLESREDQAAVAAEARAMGATVLRQYDNVPVLALTVGAQALQGLQRSPRVLQITEDEAVPPALQSSLPVINADVVHALGFDGAGVAVAILDTGIDGDHPFFGGRVVEEACFSSHDPGNGRTSLCPANLTTLFGTGSASIDVPACEESGVNICDHGTHVAGIAAGDGTGITMAPDAGVALGADIIAIQVFHRVEGFLGCAPEIPPCVRTFVSDYLAGLDRVFDLSNTHTIAAVNLSLGGGSHSSSCDGHPAKLWVDVLRIVGVSTVIAAGNDGLDAGVGSPGCISSAITVGATDDSDAVADFSNRGSLLDLFAPGVDITASAEDGGYEVKGGTSMAAPHVAGALAVLRQVLPNASIVEIENRLRNTGQAITYPSGFLDVTTPRIDLLAALRLRAGPPTLTVDRRLIRVDEGETATNTGTFTSSVAGLSFSASVGTVVDAGGGTWSWSFETSDGPTESQTVTITVTDPLGGEDQATFDLVVDNVAPQVVIDAQQVTTVDENTVLKVTAQYYDPGTGDTHSALVTCHSVDGGLKVPTSLASPPGQPTGAVAALCPFGDDSAPTFQVIVSVEDDDGGEGMATFDVTVGNVSPSAWLDVSSATVVNGAPTFLAQVGAPLALAAKVTDPGSDDVALTWDWGDRSADRASYLLNGPDPDPLPSPGVDPREVTDSQIHSWSRACVYTISLTATDDDGGRSSDRGTVLVAGSSRMARGQGYWASQYRGRSSHFDPAILECYLEITGYMSAVFDEVRNASSPSDAAQVLHPDNRGDLSQLLDRELLTAWLNFANGAFQFDELVDTDGDQVGDMAFSSAIEAAEAVRLDPTSSAAELEAQKGIVEAINLRDGG